MEIAMVITLALMGIYFVKSTDLPKDLKDRSAQLKAEAHIYEAPKTLRITIPQMTVQAMELDKLKISAEIDRLTLIITSLEQEIKANNEKNAEIQGKIDAHLENLIQLQQKLNGIA